MSEIASAFVSIMPSARGFGSALQSQVGGETNKAGGFLGGVLGKGLLAGFVAVGVAAGIGKALYEVGSTFDDLSDTIRIDTGKSGDALAGLQHDAEEVGKRVPVAFDQIGPVIADLNRRLGLTGKPLQKLSEQFLELGHLTGEAIDTKTVTGALNAFQVKGKDASGVLDDLFQVTQSTGISFGDLASTLQRNGPNLSQFGIGIKQSAVLIGSLDKAGIDSNRTLATLSKAMVTFAKDGKDPQKALLGTIDQIDSLVKRGKDADAINIAGKIFGTRGASQFIAAIKSGKVNVDALKKATTGSSDTISKAAKDTADFSEQWQMFKNRVLVALEPVATKVFNAVGQGAKDLTPAVRQLAGEFKTNVLPVLQNQVLPVVKQFGQFIKTQVVPVALELAQIYLTKVLPAVLSFEAALAQKVIPALTTFANWVRTRVIPVAIAVGQTIARDLAPTISQLGDTAVDLAHKFQTNFQPVLVKAVAVFREWWPTIKRVAEIVGRLVEIELKFYGVIVRNVLPIIVKLAGFLIGKLFGAIAEFINGMLGGADAAFKFGRKLVETVQAAVRFAQGVIKQGGRVVDWFKDLPHKISAAVGGLAGTMKKLGADIVQGLVNGIKAAAHFVEDAVNAIINKIPKKIRSLMHIGSPSKVTEELGGFIGEGLAKGIEGSAPKVESAAEKLTKKLKEKLGAIRDNLSSVRSDFASLVDPIASNFTNGLFDFTSASAFTANLTTVKGTLTTLLGNFKKLLGEGLSPGFLYQLFQSGGPGLINSLAALDAASANAAGGLFADVQNLSQQLGTAVAGATDKGAGLEKQTARLEHKLDQVIKAIHDGSKDVKDGVNNAASSGHKRGRRSMAVA